MSPDNTTQGERENQNRANENSDASKRDGGAFSRVASTRATLFGAAAVACALILFMVSRAVQRDDETFSFNATTPNSAPRVLAGAPNANTSNSNVPQSDAPQNASREYSRRAFAAPKVAATAARELIVVHVAGEVEKPGVYKMPSDARIYQAIARAGGAKNSADLNAINMAARAEDGSRVDVPAKNARREYSQVESAPRENFSPRESAPRVAASSTSPVSSREKSVLPRASSASTRAAESAARLRENPVNLNRAGAQELETLPGIGPAMSARILEFRAENGAFSSVDELDEVRGIGPKKLEKLRPLVRVN